MGLWFTPVRAPQPASALVSAYAARLAALVFQHNTGGSPPPGSVTQVDITISDVTQSNGVIHVLDRVLMPAG